MAAATHTDWGGAPDVDLALKATRAQVPIMSGAHTAVWTYRADLVTGAAASLQSIPGSYLGPIIRVRKGAVVRVRFSNELPEPSTIHWHGLLVPDRMDGHPRDAVAPGGHYRYEFPVLNQNELASGRRRP